MSKWLELGLWGVGKVVDLENGLEISRGPSVTMRLSLYTVLTNLSDVKPPTNPYF